MGGLTQSHSFPAITPLRTDFVPRSFWTNRGSLDRETRQVPRPQIARTLRLAWRGTKQSLPSTTWLAGTFRDLGGPRPHGLTHAAAPSLRFRASQSFQAYTAVS